MNDEAGLGVHTAERMLRGEPTGPPRLAALLTAVSSEPPPGRPDGEEAAVAAFREARSLPSRRSYRRRLTAAGWKAALVGLLLALAGGAAMAATGHHLPRPLGNGQPHDTPTSTISDTLQTRTTLRMSPHRAPHPQETQQIQTTPTTHATQSAHPSPTPSATGETDRPHPTKKPKTKASKSKPNKSAAATSPSATPASGADGRSSARRSAGNSVE